MTELLKINLPSICLRSLAIFFKLPLLFRNAFGDLLISKFANAVKSIFKPISFIKLNIIPIAKANKIIKLINIFDKKAFCKTGFFSLF